jgi:7-cyano-7-deazaguanine tRNA-ribosyltransferase
MKFELKDRDAAGRIGKLWIKGKRLTTPLFLPVFNPNIPVITPKEMRRDFKIDALMTNAYIIYKTTRLKEKALKGIHRFLKFPGVIFSDSGAYQAFKGKLKLTQGEIIEFQERIGSDVGVMLDVPSKQESWDETKLSVELTIERAREWRDLREEGRILWEGAVQGGSFVDLVRLSCKAMQKFEFDFFAVGVPPRLWKEYEFKKIAFQGVVAKSNLPSNKPLHAFGMGHPIALSLLVAIGYDLFDSASYATYASRLRYLTELGTRNLQELSFLPCNCPSCRRRDIDEIRELEKEEKVSFLARHNLYSILREISIVRQAIRENSLWEIVQLRARAHPKLLEALSFILKRHNKFFQGIDPIRKRSALFYLGKESLRRPELRRAIARVGERIGKKKIPISLDGTYPFGQSVLPQGIFRFEEREPSDLKRIREIADFQWGKGVGKKIFPRGVRIEKSRATKKIRRIWLRRRLLATLRASDGFFALRIEGAKLLHKALRFPSYRVVVKDDPEIIEIISKGGNLFSKFVVACHKKIIPREEVLIVTPRDELLAVGEALLAGKEMIEFEHGLAVDIREGIKG